MLESKRPFSSQVLQQFIPSAITSWQVPHVLFPLHFINLTIFFLFCFLKCILSACWPFGSQLPAPLQQQVGATAGEKSCSSTHLLIRHPISSPGRCNTDCQFCFAAVGIGHLSTNMGCVKHMKIMIFPWLIAL